MRARSILGRSLLPKYSRYLHLMPSILYFPILQGADNPQVRKCLRQVLGFIAKERNQSSKGMKKIEPFSSISQLSASALVFRNLYKRVRNQAVRILVFRYSILVHNEFTDSEYYVFQFVPFACEHRSTVRRTCHIEGTRRAMNRRGQHFPHLYKIIRA